MLRIQEKYGEDHESPKFPPLPANIPLPSSESTHQISSPAQTTKPTAK